MGNGRLGMIVPGNVTNENIVLNEDSLWSGNTNATGNYDEGPTGAFGSYQLFGNLLINLPSQSAYTGYLRTLDLNTGEAMVTYTNDGVVYTRTLFCSAPDQVILVKLTASAPAAYTGSIQLVDGHSTATVSTSGGLMFSGALANGELYEAQLQASNSGGMIVNTDGVIAFTNCDSLTLVVALGTDYAPDYLNKFAGNNPHTNVVAQAQTAITKSFSTLEAAHTNDFSALFNRVSIYLGAAPAERTNLPTDQRLTANIPADDDPRMDQLMFGYGRYVMISASRTGLPMNLQGLWNDNNNPSWSSDYHSDLNFEMMYTGVEVANLPECFGPFLNYLQSQIPVWRYFTTNTSTSINNGSYGGSFGGNNGWATRTSANIYGGQGWEWIEGANAWYCMYLWDHYAFTGDTNYLRTNAYPIMKEVCQFWQQHLIALPVPTNGEPAGTLVVTNGWSPETGPREDGVTCDQEFIWDVFSNYQQAAAILNTDVVYSATIADLQTNLLQPRIGPWGELREWFYTADVQGPNTSSSEMEFRGLYPGRQITPEVAPSLAAGARVHLLSLGDSGYEWTHAQHLECYARLHDWWNAHHALALEYTTTEPNLNGAYSSTVAQLDSSCGVTAGIAEMLLQSHAGFINLLPALPNAWPAGYVTGLRARGGYTVGITWTNAAATATITSDFSGNCTVYTPNPVAVTQEGSSVAVTHPAPGLTQWLTTSGNVYNLQWVLPPFPAQAPQPADYATVVGIGKSLSWISGGTNYQHNVYFGADSNAVMNATTSSAEYQGTFATTNDVFSQPLTNPATYFWRVDEVAGTNIGTGTLWRFTVVTNSPVITNPIACWLLSETSGPTVYDSTGNHNGTAQGDVVFGMPGVTNPPFTQFGSDNVAVQFNGTNATIAVPPLDLNTNAVTITAWLKINGTQGDYTGIVYSDAPDYSGLLFTTGNQLGYNWNDLTYGWSSGLMPPNGVWTFVALVVSPTQAVMYMATNGVLKSATNNVANSASSFGGELYLGSDNGTYRWYNGTLDQVAVYNEALTPSQVSQILESAITPTVWNGGGGNVNWSTADNWGGTSPVNWQALTFQGTQRQLNTNDFLTGAGQVTLSNGGFTLTGNALTLAGGICNQTGNNTFGINATLYTDGESFMVSNGTLAVSGDISDNGSGYGIVKGGAGTLTLSGQNTFTGTINIMDGTLNLPDSSSASSLECSVINLSPGTMLTCAYQPFGWYANNNTTGLTINITNAICQENGSFGVAYTLTGGSITGNSLRLDLGASGGFNSFITTYPSSTMSVLNPTNQILLRGDSGQTIYSFTVAAGTTSNGIDLDVQQPITQNSTACSVVKAGAGMMQLDAANSYTGATVVSGGTLLVNGSLAGGSLVSVQTNGTLGGTGIISGAVTIQSGGTLAPGVKRLGSLKVNSSPLLGGMILMGINTEMVPSNSSITIVSGSLTNGGTLVVSNMGPELVSGDSFQILHASGYIGAFTGMSLPVLSAGLVWNTNSLVVNGTISVSAAPPMITSLNMAGSGASFTVVGKGAVSEDYVLMTSGNLSPAVWTPLLTNRADANDGSLLFTDLDTINYSQRFYRIQAQ